MGRRKEGCSDAWTIIGMVNDNSGSNFFAEYFGQGAIQALAEFCVMLEQTAIHSNHCPLFDIIFGQSVSA